MLNNFNMSFDKINEILGNNALSYYKISASALANIIKFVDVNLRMDSHTLDYYYEISVDDIVNSDMPENELNVLKEQGWSFNNNKKCLVLYLKNN